MSTEILEQKTSYHHGNVRESCIVHAMEILDREGLAQLSLRKVAKAIGVSHNAPYRWFKTREDLLVAVTIRIFDEIQMLLRSVLDHPSGNASEDFMTTARTYYDYARKHPNKYRLIAGGAITNSSNYPELLQKALETLRIIHDFLDEHKQTGVFNLDDTIRMSMHFISAIHGFCSLAIEGRFDLLGQDTFDLDKQFEYTVQQLIKNIS